MVLKNERRIRPQAGKMARMQEAVQSEKHEDGRRLVALLQQP